MSETTQACPDAVAGQVDRGVRPLAGHLRVMARYLQHAQDRLRVQAAADELERLHDALAYARSGFDLAYSAAEKGFNDEVLMHCGHHGARADKVLGA